MATAECRDNSRSWTPCSRLHPVGMDYTWPGSSWRPSACEADVIATRPQVPYSCRGPRNCPALLSAGITAEVFVLCVGGFAAANLLRRGGGAAQIAVVTSEALLCVCVCVCGRGVCVCVCGGVKYHPLVTRMTHLVAGVPHAPPLLENTSARNRASAWQRTRLG